MGAIATQLEAIDAKVISWDSLDESWRNRISSAVGETGTPECLVFPTSESSLSEVVEIANKNSLSILPCGNGSKLSWGGLVKDVSIAISTQSINSLIEHAVEDFTVTVEAGMKLADLQAILSQHNQFLPLDPAYPNTATIGGIVATADAGSWRQRYGGVRDLVLGLSFVRHDGKIAKAGGRVVKNVAGYDLMKLFTGSYGTLGIISQVTLRVYPYPEDSTTLVLTGNADSIQKATATLLSSTLTPTAMNILSASMVQDLGFGEGLGLMIRFQTVSASISEQTQQVKKIASSLELQLAPYNNTEETHLWQQLETIIHPSPNNAITCKIGILPSEAVSFLTQMQSEKAMIYASSGLGRLQFPSSDTIERVEKIRSYCQENSGFLTILESPSKIKSQIDPWGYSGNALEIMQKIKHKFDPNNIFSPGCFVGKI